MADRGVIIRVDGSRESGLGHIVRCLSVASSLRIQFSDQTEISIHFIVRDDSGARKVFAESGFEENVVWIPQENDDIEKFSDVVREFSPRVVVTDIDLRGRVNEYVKALYPHPAHISLHEHNYPILAGDKVIAPTIRPLEMAPGGTPDVTHFTGPMYILLSSEILDIGKNASVPGETVKTGFITLGGGDPEKLTIKVLEAIRAYNDPVISWTVILGPASEYDKWDLVRQFPMTMDILPGNEIGRSGFLDLLMSTDAVITNGGSTLYESLALGRPTVAIPQNDFESDVAAILAEEGCCVSPDETTSPGILKSLTELIEDASLRKNISEKGKVKIDGKGAIRVAKMIAEYLGYSVNSL